MSSAGEVSGVSAFEKYFALELLYKSCNESLRSKEDALIVLAHYLLVRNRKRCAGTGEVWDDTNQHTSEVLPLGWNENQGLYTIRYISAQNNERYLLKAFRADDSLLICVLNIKEDKTASTSLNVGKYVSEEYKDGSRAFKDLNAVVEKINREVINALELSESEISGVCRASSTTSRERVLRMPTGQPSKHWCQVQEPTPLGQRDLDPFSGSTRGMIMDPREITRPPHSSHGPTIPGLPRASVPPGSRFDPFGPSSTNDPAGLRFSRPNPDHVARPPDYDDMFS
uniref:Proteasome inhibitor PI31 subunit n=1 Tax=Rhipicephalus appendiculatus TaxID=34631 RepID=A0A131YPF6_RHIAP